MLTEHRPNFTDKWYCMPPEHWQWFVIEYSRIRSYHEFPCPCRCANCPFERRIYGWFPYDPSRHARSWALVRTPDGRVERAATL